MAKLEFTPSQKAAINSRGCSVLVSAAAGSGKTRVLTQRLMSYVTDRDDPKDIDSFLIITYTRAAAAELRSRILTQLMQKAADEPENRRLRRQSNLCYRAQIGTIHSFCTTILRENAHSLGLSPDFKVIEEDRAQVIKLRCLENILEKAYGRMDDGFRSLVDTVGAGRDDARLEKIILSVYEKMCSHPDPEKWALGQMQCLKLEGVCDVSETLWGEYLLMRTQLSLDYWASEMKALSQLINSDCEYAPIVKTYGNSIEDTTLNIRDMSRAMSNGWDAARACLPISFPKLGALRNSPAPEVSDRVKSRREACKKAMGKLEEFFFSDSKELLRDMRAMAGAMQRLLELTLQFERVFSAEKRRQICVDFSDLEHLTAKLLTDEDGSPTQLAKQISLRYTEIMVDEYQDVNAVQDMLFHAVSRDGKNLFMVGDVKQSIYRFRLADPGIFLDKYRLFASMEDALPDQNCKILLRENFRSRKCVLDAANHVFKNIMSRQLGELDYDEQASLTCGAAYYEPEGEVPAQMMIIELPEDCEEERPDKTYIEAYAVGRKIRRLVESKTLINDDGVQRPLRYGDVAILLRSPGSAGGSYSMALTEQGIPVSSGQSSSFFSAPEVSAMISLLAVIDNPHQDVPLISALRSMLFCFSADELANIRAFALSGSFFDAMKLASETNGKCAGFIDLLKSLREASGDLPTDALLRRIFNETDAMARLGAMPSGEDRQVNLMQLLEYARKFEEEGFRGLFKFVASLRRMMDRGTQPHLQSAQGGNAVTIMSIHKSKGLEFPIVFLCDTARKFNKQDASETVLIHSQLGLGPKFTDLDRGIEYPTIARRAIAAKLIEETLSEEMRVLYVALTRAKERLFISCAMKNPERTIEKLRDSLDSPIPSQVLETAMSPAHWLIQTAIIDQPYLKLSVERYGAGDEELIIKPAVSVQANEDTVRMIAGRLGYKYPHIAAVDLPSKITATELKDDIPPDPDSASLLPRRRETVFRLPELGAQRELTGAEKGTATHLVMQYINFAKTASPDEIRAEINRLERGGYLTPAQASTVDPGAIEAFFMSEIGRRVLSAPRVLRELPFSLLCDAGDYFKNGLGDTLLLQGVIDCCIIENDELTIIDYKTDYVNQSNINQRIQLYSGQVRAYAMAMHRITGKKVRECVLYFLRGKCAAIVDENGKNIRILL